MIKKEMEKREFLLLLFVLFVGANAFGFFILKQTSAEGNWGIILQSVIQFWTGVVLIWYTWETWKIRQVAQSQVGTANKQIEVSQFQVMETQRQIEILQRPFVTITVAPFLNTTSSGQPLEGSFEMFGTINLGNNIALNVRIGLVWVREEDHKCFEVTVRPLLSAALVPHQKAVKLDMFAEYPPRASKKAKNHPKFVARFSALVKSS